MMASEIKYRLGEYVIIEQGGMLLTWVSHIALGAQLSGRCFILGNILVIGPKEHEEAGFLTLEFYEQLAKLPAWIKTTYYCFASCLRKVGTEQSITSDWLEHPDIPEVDKKIFKTNGPGTFRLGRYKITVDKSGIVSWQTMGELHRIISGECIIESGILFIGPQENESEEGQSRKDFFAGQKLLRQWDRTFAWGRYGSLMKSKEPENRISYAPIWTPENVKARKTSNGPFFQSHQSRREEFQELTASGSEWLRTIWHRIFEWKIWSRLTPVLIAGVLMGFRCVFFIIGKGVSLSFRIIDRFRAHRKE
jgi:hypothetical protein